MSAKATSGRNWSRLIFILLVSLSVIGALLVWLVNYDDIWKFWRHESESLDKIYANSPDKIYANSLIFASESGELFLLINYKDLSPNKTEIGNFFVFSFINSYF